MKAISAMSLTKIVALCAASAALTAMGVVSARDDPAGIGGASAVAAGGTQTSPVPKNTPTVPSAAPEVKATAFNGGDWPGMGSFGESTSK